MSKIKTRVKIKVTPRQSEKVQQICFNNDIYWASTGRVIEKDIEYIFISSRELTTTDSLEFFNRDKYKEIDADLFIKTHGTCDDSLVEVDVNDYHLTYDELSEMKINYTLGANIQSKIASNTFEQYGFETPIFKCKLFDKLDDEIFGAYYNPNKKKWVMCRWDLQGNNKQGSHNYRLEIIVIPWYEACTFPILVKDSRSDVMLLSELGEWSKQHCTPLTDDEIDNLKQGFQNGMCKYTLSK